MIRVMIALLSLAATVACQAKKTGADSQVDFAKGISKALPKITRCSQLSNVESISVRETLLIKFTDEVVSGTYHFATGDKNTINDAGFQHLSGRVDSIETKDNIISVSLNEGSLSVYFDEDFAPEKKLKELRFNLNDKKVSFLLEDDSRETVVGSCTFE